MYRCACGFAGPPVVVGAVLAVGRVGGYRGDDLLGVCVDQLDRVDGQVLVEVRSALGCVRTQVTLILPLLCSETQHTHTHTHTQTHTIMRMCARAHTHAHTHTHTHTQTLLTAGHHLKSYTLLKVALCHCVKYYSLKVLLLFTRSELTLKQCNTFQNVLMC